MRRGRRLALKFRARFGEWHDISDRFWKGRGTIWMIFGWRNDDTIADSREDFLVETPVGQVVILIAENGCRF